MTTRTLKYQHGQSTLPYLKASPRSSLNRPYGHKVDWNQVAEALGQASCSTLLHNVATSTKWRRMMGKKSGSVVQFACTVQGKVHGPLGPDLVMATVNLIARGLHLDVSKNDLKPHPPSKQEHVTSSANMNFAEVPERFSNKASAVLVRFPYYEERCQMRASYLKFLQEQLDSAEDYLSFNAILEDDDLSSSFLEARGAGIDPASVLPMVLKAEGDATPGHVCYFGPKAIEFFLGMLGLDYGIATTDQLLRDKALPKPFTVVHHGQHWVPMWSKVVGAEYKSRPWLPLEPYDLYLERYGPPAEAAAAHMDCTCLAAGYLDLARA